MKCVLREVEGISVISDSFFSCCGAESRLSSDLFAVHFIRNLGRVRKSGMDGSRMTEPGDETEKKNALRQKRMRSEKQVATSAHYLTREEDSTWWLAN